MENTDSKCLLKNWVFGMIYVKCYLFYKTLLLKINIISLCLYFERYVRYDTLVVTRCIFQEEETIVCFKVASPRELG